MVYGAKMQLVELGTISAPQPTLLTIQVWDPSLVPAIEKAIFESSLGLTPSTEGQVVRLAIPPLSEERREEFAKISRQKGEECKISIRQIRADERDKWIKDKADGVLGEDQLFHREKSLQELVDKTVSEADQLVKIKEEELRQI